MVRTSYTFDKIETKRTKYWKDPVTGRKRQKTRTFWQTSNPFNNWKSAQAIWDDITKEAEEWVRIPPEGVTKDAWLKQLEGSE